MLRRQVLAARDGVVAAFCDHFNEGGLRENLLPRANFVALRHLDGTYTRYVHLMHGGVLVRLGQASTKGVDEGLTLSTHVANDVRGNRLLRTGTIRRESNGPNRLWISWANTISTASVDP